MHSTTTTPTTSDVHRSLPPELIDRILDFLHNDRPALVNCALACSAWLPTSRFHLFASISIRAPSVSAFQQVLDECPPLGDYIRDMTLSPLNDASIRHLPAIPLAILQTRRMANLHHLRLRQVLVRSFIELVHVISLQPILRSLVMTIVTSDPVEQESRAASQYDVVSSTTLKSMELTLHAQGFPHGEFSRELISSGAVARLERFVLRVFPEDFLTWVPFLRAISGTLVDLRVRFYMMTSVINHQHDLFVDVLQRCPSLRTLGVEIRCIPQSTLIFEPMNAFPVLRALSSKLSDSPAPLLPRLECFLFRVEGAPLQFVNGCGAAFLDITRVLKDQSRYPAFRLVRARCNSPTPYDPDDPNARHLRDLLAALHEEGVEATVTYPSQNAA